MVTFLTKLKGSLTKTRQSLVEKVSVLVAGHRRIDEELYDELETILLQADVGVAATERLIEEIRRDVREKRLSDSLEVKGLLKQKMKELLGAPQALTISPTPPSVILVVGVNGVGKTTTIGKLASRYRREGKRVLIVAADTFRAAAIEQLEIWAQRTGADLIKHQAGSDPAAVVFDALQAARKRSIDLVLIDTAGRLHTKANLMDELGKIKRVIGREISSAPQEVLLVIDATTGQNALRQAELFQQTTGVTGIALTKLDGTAKGGVVLGIAEELKIPVKLVGIGEHDDDLKEFKGSEFVEALFGEEEI